MVRAKQNINGDTLVLNEYTILYYRKDSGKLFKIVSFPDADSAKREFNRETNSYRGCGKNVYMKHPQARIYYGQLIIEM